MGLPSTFVSCKKGEPYNPKKPGLDASGLLTVDDAARLEAYQKREWVDRPSWEFLCLPDPYQQEKESEKKKKKDKPAPPPFWFKFDPRDDKQMVILRCYGKLQAADDLVPLCRHFNKVFKKRKHFDLVVDLNGFKQLEYKEALHSIMQFLVGPASAQCSVTTNSTTISASEESRAIEWFRRVAILRSKSKDEGDLFNRLRGLAASRLFFPVKELRQLRVGVFENKKDIDTFLQPEKNKKEIP